MDVPDLLSKRFNPLRDRRARIAVRMANVEIRMEILGTDLLDDSRQNIRPFLQHVLEVHVNARFCLLHETPPELRGPPDP